MWQFSFVEGTNVILSREEAFRKLQITEIEILDAVSGFFERHNITWFLDSGTVLGAMRHGGFIPWDDDIDIGMLRDDFEKFLELSALEDFPKGFSVHTISDTPGFGGMYAKVFKDGTEFRTKETVDAGFAQGIFIDVFPYDFLSNDPSEASKQLGNARLWQSVSFLMQSGEVRVPDAGAIGFLEHAACKIAHPLVKLLFNQDKVVSNYKRSILKNSKKYSNICVPLPYSLKHPLDTLIPTCQVEFDGKIYPAPADCNNYLTIKYGDWQKLPPKDERKTHLPMYLDFGDETFYMA